VSFRPVVVIPTYDNPRTIRRVVTAIRAHAESVLVVDDGSGPAARAEIDRLGGEGLAQVVRREVNGGKGAAVKTGIRAAAAAGFTHVLQIDADGQHTLDDLPTFLAAAAGAPQGLVLGYPIFDGTVPAARLWGRKLTNFWVHVETGGQVIRDPMCGFRVYPVAAALQALPRADRMDFDPEIAVRLVWAGLPVINIPTRVRYLSAAEGGVSHFRLWRDNVRISWMHTRLVFSAPWGLLNRRRRLAACRQEAG
jgi:glycosyltransferase involved in cell wall biosynthesis